LNNKFYMDQNVKRKLDQEEGRRMKSGRGVRQGFCLSPILLNFTANTLLRRLLKALVTSK